MQLHERVLHYCPNLGRVIASFAESLFNLLRHFGAVFHIIETSSPFSFSKCFNPLSKLGPLIFLCQSALPAPCSPSLSATVAGNRSSHHACFCEEGRFPRTCSLYSIVASCQSLNDSTEEHRGENFTKIFRWTSLERYWNTALPICTAAPRSSPSLATVSGNQSSHDACFCNCLSY